MSRKGENIYKRKDGRWEGRYKKGRKESGQLQYGYIYGKTYGEVKERLYSFKLKYQTIIQLHGESTLSYEEWGGIWLKQQQGLIKHSTYTSYLYKLKKYIFPVIGQTPLNQLTTNQIQELIEEFQKRDLESTTIHVLYQILKKSLKEAVEQKRILQTPCQMIRLPKKKKNRASALTKKEQERLEKKAKTLPLYKGLPVLLALNAGLRIGEIAALRWEDVDLDQRIIHIHQTFQRLPLEMENQKTQLVFDNSKTESSNRVVPISFSLYKYLKKWRKKAPGAYVCSNKSTPSEPRLLTYYFHEIREICGINSVHFHQLRHTFATRCIESNGDIASVSKLLGHTSTQTTLDIYTDSLLESRQQVIEKMELAKSK
ncbi:integrase [Enterococcus plantarum]|uniref:tyrosine-type recombinase/integrase n=1 Tax=Enterococcus plantarum TaxID=1077675 RepID=UPI00084D9450|nr:site-specific integrase [Enterococcus plantarum]OEG17777.1 integrase [Enterococcus plantarum]